MASEIRQVTENPNYEVFNSQRHSLDRQYIFTPLPLTTTTTQLTGLLARFSIWAQTEWWTVRSFGRETP